ncbi:sugar phosphate isomerase/epimerase [uncultured Oscillibacter sp.]|uniref:sugar phosphate isomerase/epimerase family protein n=1 Tax=uncultured Oscillibacter sp. TaxID=876091 RepID=UPI0025EE4A4E|nr:sugar phosphate isomerase/epimerase [uncultured Oscillibacter sp.]
MRLAVKTCTLDMPYEEMLDFCAEQGVSALEIGTGNWSAAPHADLDGLLDSGTARERWLDAQRRRGLSLCALNCSGNPLAYRAHMEVTEKTFRLAELLGVEKIVMMSGLPAGCPGDRTPVWVTASWPPETQEILDYQWNEAAVPAWERLVRLAQDHGIRRIALENHGMQLVYNPETLLRLRAAVGPTVGMNLDPSHLFWMGGDPIEAARVLGEQGAIYHIHGKDARRERRMAGPNGMLDTRPIGEFRARAWNYVAVGAGHGLQWWREFFSVVRMSGYDEEVSLEMEDLTLPVLDGHLASLRTLRDAL